MAAFNLGLLLHQTGDLQGAAAAYWRAMVSRNPDVAPLAAAKRLSMASSLHHEEKEQQRMIIFS